MWWYLIGAVCALAGYIVWETLARCKDLPPGPWGLPVVGYLPWLDPASPHLSLTRLAERYGPVYSVRLGGIFVVVLADARTIRQTLAKDAFAGRADLFVTHGIMGGYGLVVAEGERWKEQRKFVSANLRNYGVVKIGSKRTNMEQRIMYGVKEAVQMLRECEGPLDPCEILMHSMGNILNFLLLGKRWAMDDPAWVWLRKIAEEGVKLIGVAGPLNFLPFLRWLPQYKNVLKFLLEGKEKSHKMYDEVLAEVESKNGGIEGGDHLGAVFLREMAKGRGGHFTVPQLHHLIADLWGAGVDTTLTTLRWFLLYITLHTEYQDKIREELKEVVGVRDWPTLEDCEAVPFLEASIAEAQRIRSVVPLGMPRGGIEEAKIGEYRIPKGAMVVPLQWAVHMDPKVWPQPQVFNPYRFINEQGQFFKPESFMPFQSGKRSCIGEEMGRMMVTLFGAAILHHFRLTWAGGDAAKVLEGVAGITLVPHHHLITFTPQRP